ncbi:MAG: helix-turn-helix transcriptional regulator [Solirubrobacterales bacterium]|nr:helix-turn-helix transcriptional regulator [Solirubrobacterales bacterium]
MSPEESRELTDPRAMRAITHPVRLALIEALGLEGPLTATRAAEVIGESPTTCSFHFRQLAKYGFVEEASTGPGRTRSWRLTRVGMHFTDVHDEPETRIAARALARTLRERSLERLDTYYELRSSYPPRWQEVTGASEFMLHVTPDELQALDEEITEILRRFRDRIARPELRPEESLPVEVLLFAYPVRPARDGSGDLGQGVIR